VSVIIILAAVWLMCFAASLIGLAIIAYGRALEDSDEDGGHS
jgi:hypothetical protein